MKTRKAKWLKTPQECCLCGSDGISQNSAGVWHPGFILTNSAEKNTPDVNLAEPKPRSYSYPITGSWLDVVKWLSTETGKTHKVRVLGVPCILGGPNQHPGNVRATSLLLQMPSQEPRLWLPYLVLFVFICWRNTLQRKPLSSHKEQGVKYL